MDSPEAAVEHMERFVISHIEQAMKTFDEDAHVKALLEGEKTVL